MRRVSSWELVSLDGVMERPEEWAFSYSDDKMGERVGQITIFLKWSRGESNP